MLLLQRWVTFSGLCCVMAPLRAALLKLLDVFENRVIQFGDSVWEALKFLAQVEGKCTM